MSREFCRISLRVHLLRRVSRRPVTLILSSRNTLIVPVKAVNTPRFLPVILLILSRQRWGKSNRRRLTRWRRFRASFVLLRLNLGLPSRALFLSVKPNSGSKVVRLMTVDHGKRRRIRLLTLPNPSILVIPSLWRSCKGLRPSPWQKT